MKIVDIFILFFVTFTTLVHVHSKPVRDYRTILLPDEMIRLKKRNVDSSTSYLEQCGIVKFPNVQKGVVNVLAFLDSSWPYSHRQAIMLKMLNERLRRSGLVDTIFFVINVDPSYKKEIDAADDIEREAWLGVSPDEIERFSEIVKTTDSLAMSMNPDINLIQDDENLGIWKELRGSRDQVLVIDRCGQLAYQVIVPWSILHFPYVKAAILSTYKDEPCGPCSIQRDNLEISTRKIENYKDSVINESVSETFNVPENWIISTEYQDKTTLDSSTSEASTRNFVESLDITTVTDMTHYLIAEENYPTTESTIKKYEEPTSLMMTVGEINEAENPHTTNDYKGIIDNTIDTLMRTTTEENLDSRTEKVIGIQENSKDLENGKYLLHQEDKNDASVMVTDTIDTLFDTSTEENLDFQTVKVFGAEEKSNELKNRIDLLDHGEVEYTSDIVSDTIDKLIEMTTEENLDSQTVKVLGAKEKSSTLDQEDMDHDTTFIIQNTIDTVIDTTTEENLRLQTIKVIGIEEISLDLKNEKNLLVPEDRNDTAVTIANTIVTLVNTTEENFSSQTVKVLGIQEKPNDLKNEKNLLAPRDKNDTNIIIITTIDPLIDKTTEEISDFPTTQIIQYDKFVDSKMGASVDSVTNFPNYDPTGINSVTTNDHSTMNTNMIFDIDTTTEQMLDSSTNLNEDHAILSDMPIRIIMHAPHFHADGDSTRMHEYIVFETGSPMNHGHLASHDATRLYSGPQDFQEKVENLEEIENKKWSMKNLIYNKDESTGLYGEVADYWRDLGNLENYEDAEETERPEDERISDDASVNDKLWNKPSKINNEKLSNDDKNLHDESISSELKNTMKTTEKLQESTEPEEFNLEEETRNKLIAHYSKLLPWIYYVLDK